MTAPYSDTAISIYLRATNGPKYRILSCVECAESFLERQDEDFYRINVVDMPEKASLSDTGAISTKCGKCQQKYTVHFSSIQATYRGDPLAYQKPLTIFVTNAPIKTPRDAFCLECHHAYLSISDRVHMIADEVVPLEKDKVGPIEVRCKFHNCKQRWQVVS